MGGAGVELQVDFLVALRSVVAPASGQIDDVQGHSEKQDAANTCSDKNGDHGDGSILPKRPSKVDTVIAVVIV